MLRATYGNQSVVSVRPWIGRDPMEGAGSRAAASGDADEMRGRAARARAARGVSFAAMRSSLFASVTIVSLCVGATACNRDAPRPDQGSATTVASGTPATTNGEVTVGKPAPDFKAKDHNGAELELSALKGKPVVVYFYPKDETPGCTTEAKDFRDQWKGFEKTGVTVIGISTDNPESHKAFAKHHELPFHLVSDESGAIAKSFGVPNRAGFLSRQTFVIGADGNVKKIYRDVDVSKHVTEVLADLKS
ncbi:MAG: Thiol peroxidase, Bcp-type [Labilithrix sp.]|nr:Thiol peroxidase, Bcp-type [Labilithrix sp.]